MAGLAGIGSLAYIEQRETDPRQIADVIPLTALNSSPAAVSIDARGRVDSNKRARVSLTIAAETLFGVYVHLLAALALGANTRLQ